VLSFERRERLEERASLRAARSASVEPELPEE